MRWPGLYIDLTWGPDPLFISASRHLRRCQQHPFLAMMTCSLIWKKWLFSFNWFILLSMM